MALSQMQDIGGCRGVVSSVARVRALRDLYHKSDLRHHLVREKDYITDPKPDGYRSVHLVYRYMSDKNDTYNRLQIEMQLRSPLQHAWATAVETVGTFLQQALKASHGPEEWLRFFALMGSAIARRERTPIVPGTPQSKYELVQEIKHYASRLDVAEKLRLYGRTIQTLEKGGQLKEGRYFLLEVRPSEGKATIYGFAGNELDRATKKYLDVEQALKGPGSEAVLVSVDSLASLKRAYPSYFLNTDAFLQAMQAAIS